MDQAVNAFGSYLKKLREQKGFSVNQLSVYSGVSAAQISRIENAVRGVPKPETIQKLSSALKVSYEEVMKKAGHIIQDTPKPKEEGNLAFLGGGENLTEDEIEHLQKSLEDYRRLKEKFMKNKNN